MPQSPRPPGSGAALLRTAARPAWTAVDALLAHSAPRILIVKTHDQLGDFLVATPALNALRARFPGARLELVTRDYLAPLARRQPALDQVHVLPRFRGPASLTALVTFTRSLRDPIPDAAFVLNSVSRSGTADLVAAASFARLVVGRSRVGPGSPEQQAPADPYAPARERLIAGHRDDAVYDLDLAVARTSVHQVERLLDLVRWTGAGADRMTLAVSAEERARGLAALPGGAPRVGVHPAAANALKCWPEGSFVELAARLAQAGAAIHVFDTPKEPGPARAVHGGLAQRGVAAGLVPAGSLDAFVVTASGLDLMISNDSGVMHIAAALGVPTVSLHSLGRPEEWAPRGPNAIALHADPIAGIAVGDAFDAASKLLSSRG